MTEHRHHNRFDIEDDCKLQLNYLYYSGTVKNISFGGALVHLYDPLPELHVGDICDISMDGEFLREYSCEVVRVKTPDIGLMFTGMAKLKAVTH
jgi:hypothetical protein